jgi:membrane protein
MAILFSLWSANAGSKAIFDSLNVATDSTEKRSFVRLTLISLAFTMGGLAFMLVAVGAVIVMPLIFAAIGLGSLFELILSIGRWPLLFLLIAIGLSVTYYIGPSRDHAQWRWITPGSLFASFLFLVISAGFSWYLSKFTDYNATYGSLGAAIGLMMWLWLTFCAVLLGAELDSEVNRARDPGRPVREESR